MKTRNNILAFNQMAGSLFYEKMQFIAENIGGTATIVTSYNDSLKEAGHSSLIVVPAPEYDRRSLLFRLLSWIKYTVFCIPL